MALHFSLDFSQKLGIICRSLKSQTRKADWLEFLFTSIYPRLGAGEACTPETSTGVNKKTSPRKACSPIKGPGKGQQTLTAGKPAQPSPGCPWGHRTENLGKEAELTKFTQTDSERK